MTDPTTTALRVAQYQRAKAQRARAGGWTPTRAVPAQEIEAAKTPAGAWTRATLAGWGVPWPPPKGWRKRLEAGAADP